MKTDTFLTLFGWLFGGLVSWLFGYLHNVGPIVVLAGVALLAGLFFRLKDGNSGRADTGGGGR